MQATLLHLKDLGKGGKVHICESAPKLDTKKSYNQNTNYLLRMQGAAVISGYINWLGVTFAIVVVRCHCFSGMSAMHPVVS